MHRVQCQQQLALLKVAEVQVIQAKVVPVFPHCLLARRDASTGR